MAKIQYAVSDEVRKRLAAVKKVLRSAPKKYDQKQYCGTAQCIAGHLVACEGGRLYDGNFNPLTWKEAQDAWISDVFVKIGREAPAKFLTVVNNLMESIPSYAGAAINLFQSHDSWPAPFGGDYARAKTAKQRVKVAIARINYFERTGQ